MGMTSMIEALIMLFVFIIVFYITMVIWEPITTLSLYPLLNNTAAFTHGPTAVVLLQLFVLVAVASGFIAFFNQARGGERPPQQYGY